MVHRLLEPILWRHLKVPILANMTNLTLLAQAINEVVRLNAAEMFLAAFPLEDSGATREERESALTTQHTALSTLLTDPSPDIRASAALGVSGVLTQYWCIIPSYVINSLVKIIVKELTCDSSSTKVRVAAVQGVKTLLSTPASHVYLRKVLPRLADRVHDTSEAVRGAVLELLLTVKAVKSIRFWDVVPLEALLARLEVDKPFICRRIVKLLRNSFWPTNASDEVALERCINLVQMSRAASRRFYQHATEDLAEASRLILAILQSLRLWVRGLPLGEEEEEEGRGKGKRKLYNNTVDDTMSTTLSSVVEPEPEQEKEDGEEDEEHPYKDQEVVWGVMDVVCVLWMQHNSALCSQEHSELRSIIEKKAGKCLVPLFKQLRASPACETVVYLASFLPDKLVSPLASYCQARARAGTEHWKVAVDSLVNWKRGESLLEMVQEGLTVGLREEEVQGKGVRFAETQSREEGLQLGLRLLEYLVNNHIIRSVLVAKHRAVLEEVMELCLSCISTVEARLAPGQQVPEEEGRLLPRVLQLGAQLAVVVLPAPLPRLEELLAWSERELTGQEGLSRAQVVLAQTTLRTVASLSTATLVVGTADAEFSDKLVDWVYHLLGEEGEAQLATVLSLLLATATRAEGGRGEEWSNILTDKVLVGVARVLGWLVNEGGSLEQGGEGIEAITKGFGQLLKFYSKLGDEETLVDLLEVIVAMVVRTVGEEVEQTGLVQVATVLDQLGSIPGALLQAVQASGVGEHLASALCRKLEEQEGEEGEQEVVTAATVAGVFMVGAALSKEEVVQKVEDVISAKVVMEEIQGEEKEVLEKVMDCVREVRTA